ncbi:MAG: lipoyl(octanoyl) transferase LipB [Porticoccaceae bacterium]|nr:lipoyl(octanoyl) transferase LipB [Porticoccaceae bacterium]
MNLIVRQLGIQRYAKTYAAMKNFTATRAIDTDDEIWILQHEPVFTQGRAANAKHILSPGDIPVVNSDRGGDVTYHGPGQITAYLLIDLKRRKLGIRKLVKEIECAILHTLKHWQVPGQTRNGAPGIYVNEAKIASLGLRVRHGCSYHGLSLNVDMDLSVWQRINPCGLDVAMTHLRDLVDVKIHPRSVAEVLLAHLCTGLGYTKTCSMPAAT